MRAVSQLADCRTRAKLRTNAQRDGTGLVVTELMGQGVSAITGDFPVVQRASG